MLRPPKIYSREKGGRVKTLLRMSTKEKILEGNEYETSHSKLYGTKSSVLTFEDFKS